MKTSKHIQTILLIAIFCLQAVAIFAEGTDSKSDARSNEAVSSIFITLAPTMPVEATFEDVAVVSEFSALMPVTPMEADFNDVAAVESMDITNLAPVEPVEADFSDTPDMTIDNSILAPFTPFAADFE
jgi:hypothetical protein